MEVLSVKANKKEKTKKIGFCREMKKNGLLYLLVLPVIAFYFVFNYMPMYGVLMSFQNYSPRLGILHSEWIGLANYKTFFTSPDCVRVICSSFSGRPQRPA